jgi:putative hydrolase of the HAD superfamily
MGKKYTHLFFDLDNTLWDFERNSYDALRIVFNFYKCGEQGIDFKQFYNVYTTINRFYWSDYRQGIIGKKELVSLRFEKTLKEFGIRGIDGLEMNVHYLKEMPNQKRLIEGTPQLLVYLKSKGYFLHIITNGFTEVQYKKLENTGIKKYFNRVFTSEQVNAPKPSRLIFEYAIKSANAKKSSSLMIGDDAEADIKGALDVGIDAVQIGENNKINQNHKPGERGPKVYFISSLSDLIKIL